MIGFRYCKLCGSKYEYTSNPILCQKCGERTTGIKLKEEQINQPIFCPKCKCFRTTDETACSYCKSYLTTLEDYQGNYKQYTKYYERPKTTTNTTNLNSSKSNNQPKCPTCQSTKIKKISDLKKATGFMMVGIFSSNFGKTMECENCGYKW